MLHYAVVFFIIALIAALFGFGGIAAGAAGIARAADYVRAFPDQIAVLLSVELCSLTIQRGDLSIPNLIATGLFGDGAAAAVLVGAEAAERLRITRGYEVAATRSVFYPNTEGVMGWDISGDGFQIVLSADVPKMVESHLRADVDAFLAEHPVPQAKQTLLQHLERMRVSVALNEREGDSLRSG